MKYLLPLIILIFAFSVIGQKKRSVQKFPQNTILSTVLNDLSTPNICGSPEFAYKAFFSGRIVKRVFDDNETNLTGIVIADAKDRRTFINLDDEHISGLAESASSDLADYLLKDLRVKVWAYRCSHIFYAYKIQPL